MKKDTAHIMPAVPETSIGAVVRDEITIAGVPLKIERPARPETLLELSEVLAAHDADEYMPYWATIWPVCLHVAELILRAPWSPGIKAIELGCGLGIPAIAAMKAGLDVTFSDYDETALRYAGRNAVLNGCPEPRLVAVDLRAPLAERFDLVIASDLIYEERLVSMLVAAFDAMLADEGVALVADPNRAHAAGFCAALKEAGYGFEAHAFQVDKTTGWEASGTVYWVRRQINK